jgi:DNA-3-methyladenine glycosylase
VTLVGRDFFDRPAGEVAPDLIGCTLLHGGAGGVIVEVERYEQHDAASHSHRGPTPRARVMFGPAGRLYVYRSYGLHWCANIVCDAEGTGAAVLLRALQPTHGLDAMRARRPGRTDAELCAGPGRLTAALGIDAALDGAPLADHPDDDPALVRVLARTGPVRVLCDRRIGISRDTERPWRYLLAGSRWWSRPPTGTPQTIGAPR